MDIKWVDLGNLGDICGTVNRLDLNNERLVDGDLESFSWFCGSYGTVGRAVF